MPTIEISDQLAEQLKIETDQAVRDELVLSQARHFTDSTSLSDRWPRLMHSLTGRILTVKAEWEDGDN